MTADPTATDPWPFPPPEAASPAAPPDDDLAGAFARCFAGADGARVLDHLRAATLLRSLGPEASDGALRHLEGQRALVGRILGLVARGGGTAGGSGRRLP
jgi:hypothetical protein